MPFQRDYPNNPYSSTDAETLRVWSGKYPEAQLALHLGRSGLVVIDVDSLDGERTLQQLEAELGPLPATAPVVFSGLRDDGRRNCHIYLRCPEGAKLSTFVRGLKSKALELPGLDLLAGPQLAYAPPTQHYSGVNYTESRDCPLPRNAAELAAMPELPDTWLRYWQQLGELRATGKDCPRNGDFDADGEAAASALEVSKNQNSRNPEREGTGLLEFSISLSEMLYSRSIRKDWAGRPLEVGALYSRVIKELCQDGQRAGLSLAAFTALAEGIAEDAIADGRWPADRDPYGPRGFVGKAVARYRFVAPRDPRQGCGRLRTGLLDYLQELPKHRRKTVRDKPDVLAAVLVYIATVCGWASEAADGQPLVDLPQDSIADFVMACLPGRFKSHSQASGVVRAMLDFTLGGGAPRNPAIPLLTLQQGSGWRNVNGRMVLCGNRYSVNLPESWQLGEVVEIEALRLLLPNCPALTPGWVRAKHAKRETQSTEAQSMESNEQIQQNAETQAPARELTLQQVPSRCVPPRRRLPLLTSDLHRRCIPRAGLSLVSARRPSAAQSRAA